MLLRIILPLLTLLLSITYAQKNDSLPPINQYSEHSNLTIELSSIHGRGIIKENDSIVVTDLHKVGDITYYSTKQHGVICIKNDSLQYINAGIPQKIVNNKKMYRIITHIGGNSSQMYITTKHNIFVKKLSDTSWTKLNGDWADITGADMDEYGNIVVGTALRGIFVSKDSAKTFYRLPYPKSAHEPLGNFESASFVKLSNRTVFNAYQFNGIIYAIELDSLNDSKRVLNSRKKKLTDIYKDVHYNEIIFSKVSPVKFPLSSIHDAEILSNTLKDVNGSLEMIVYTPEASSMLRVTSTDTTVETLPFPKKLSLIKGNYSNRNFIISNYYNADALRMDNKDLHGNDTLISHYIPTYKFKTKSDISKQINRYKNSKINAFVVDLKDDFGYLRYNSDIELAKKAKTVRPFIKDLQYLLEELHKNNIKFIARIVVFKDEKMSKYNNDTFAIWDSKTNQAMRNEKESWCDPYNVEYGDYVLSIAKELEAFGVDEIQFDYIRFPTDYLPKSTFYRFKTKDANNRDAIETFLSRAHATLTVPISADIYGGSGWYNKSTGVGQELDMLKNYVDIVCPMYYPSHYMDSFFTHDPIIERPYRIYAHGVIRAKELSSDMLKIRPYIQAFTLGGVSKYDRKYCKLNAPYFPQQVDACIETNSAGYGYWNAAGDTKYIKELIKK